MSYSNVMLVAWSGARPFEMQMTPSSTPLSGTLYHDSSAAIPPLLLNQDEKLSVTGESVHFNSIGRLPLRGLPRNSVVRMINCGRCL